jgi:hypothetical protein
VFGSVNTIDAYSLENGSTAKSWTTRFRKHGVFVGRAKTDERKEMTLEPRICKYCKATFRVLPMSNQSWCSDLCFKTHDPENYQEPKRRVYRRQKPDEDLEELTDTENGELH